MSTPTMLDQRECEHGLSLALCAGPMHYPADTEEHYSTGELMRDTANRYHAEGLVCPWDCGSCPGSADEQEYLASLEAEQAEEPEPVYLVTTAYGTETCLTYEAAKATARTAAQVTGRAVTVKKV